MAKPVQSTQPLMSLSVLTLAIWQVSTAQAAAPITATEQIAMDSNNVAHVVVNASLDSDPTAATVTDKPLPSKVLDLQQAKTSDTANALTELAGVNVQTAGGISALPIFQGVADNRLRIMVDGVDSISSCPNHMNSPLSYVAPTAIKKAKVYAGVTPVSVSGNSIGSTIVVETVKPKFAKPKVKATVKPKAQSNRLTTGMVADTTPSLASNGNTTGQSAVNNIKVVANDGTLIEVNSPSQPLAMPVPETMPEKMPVTASESASKSVPAYRDGDDRLSNSPTQANRINSQPMQNGQGNTFSQSLAKIETSGEIGSYYRSNGHQAGANLEITTAGENTSLTYKGNYARSNDYKAGGDFKTYTDSGNVGQTIAKDVVASTAFETMNQSLDLAYLTGNHLWQFGYNWQHVPEELYPNQRMDMLDNRLDRYNLRYTGDLSWGALEAQAYYEDVDHFMDFGGDKRYWYGMPGSVADSKNLNGKPCPYPGTAGCANGMPMYTESQTTGVNLKASRQLNEQTNVRVGAEYQGYQLDDWWPASGGGMYPNTFQNLNNGQRKRTSVWGEWEKAINPTWTTIAGLRYENIHTQVDPVHGYNTDTAPNTIPATGNGAMNQTRDAVNFNNSDLSKTDNNWNASLINRWQLNDSATVELGLSRQVRSPSLYERYTWSTATMMAGMNNTVGDGNGYFGDPNLKPETANKIAVTLDWRANNDKWGVKFTPYYSQVDDYIDAVQWDSTTNQPKPVNDKNKYSVMRYTNQDARIYGADISADIKLADTKAGKFGLTGAINYTNGKNTETDSPLYNIMPLNGKLALTHEVKGWSNKLEVIGVTAKDDVSIPRNEIKTAGYGLLNLSTGYDVTDKLKVTVGVDNVLDKKYALPLGGAYMGQGRTMSMNSELGNVNGQGISNWGTPVYGAGRSYFASVNYKF